MDQLKYMLIRHRHNEIETKTAKWCRQTNIKRSWSILYYIWIFEKKTKKSRLHHCLSLCVCEQIRFMAHAPVSTFRQVSSEYSVCPKNKMNVKKHKKRVVSALRQ